MKNKSKSFTHIFWTGWLIGLIILIFIILTIYIRIHQNTGISQVCSDKNCFTVEIARTQAEQEQGLMYRTAMAEHHGMIFIFPTNDLYNFRMKNTLIPLDMVRINDHMKVVHVASAVPCTADPCAVYRPEIFSKYVLEINAWMAAKYGIKEWTVTRFQDIR